jgi:cobalt-zinc-cadmium efflux system membrane fusion protein
MMTKTFPFHLIFGVFASTLVFSCGQSGTEDLGIEITEASVESGMIQLSTAQFETMDMAWGKLDSGEFSAEITVQGSVRVPVESMQEVTTFYGGYVSGMELLEGQAVKKGEVLFYLENPEFILLQQNYLEAKSQLNYLKADYERQKMLFEEQITSQKNYFKAEADYESTRAKAESLKRQLSMLRINVDQLQPESIRSKIPIYSPISGFVTSIHAVPGAYIQPTDVAVSLISKEHLHMELVIFEKEAMLIKKGQMVEVRIPEVSSDIMIAEVFMVGQSINEARQINVHAHLIDESKESMLVPGMFIEGKVQVDPKKGISLPQTAVVQSDGKMFVLVLREKNEEGYSLEKIEVQAGKVGGGAIQILPGSKLSTTDQILVSGGFNLLQ